MNSMDKSVFKLHFQKIPTPVRGELGIVQLLRHSHQPLYLPQSEKNEDHPVLNRYETRGQWETSEEAEILVMSETQSTSKRVNK